MNWARHIAPIPFLLLVAACATPLPPPAPLPDRSIVAISVKTRPPIGIGKETNPGVYFVRLDGESGLTSETIFSSNYTLGDYVFLVNAPPGRYAAVAAQTVATVETTTNTTTVHQDRNVTVTVGVGFQTAVGKATYFPEQVIRQTIVEVPAGATVFMGDFVLGTSVGLGGADPTQHYYRQLIQPNQSSGIEFESIFSVSAIYRGSPDEADQGAEAVSRFLAESKDLLTAGGWSVTPGAVSTAPSGAD